MKEPWVQVHVSAQEVAVANIATINNVKIFLITKIV